MNAPTPSDRGWNSWRAEYPAEIAHRPLGLAIAPAFYAASRAHFTDFPAIADALRFGPRDIRPGAIAFTLHPAGSEIAWRWDCPPSPAGVEILRGAWRAGRLREWGLRIWVNLAIDFRPELAADAGPDRMTRPIWRFDPESGYLRADYRGFAIALLGEKPPLLATFHKDRAALAEEYARHGYFYLESRGIEGSFPVLRYNLDEMAECAFAIAIAKDRALADRAAREALEPPPLSPKRLDDCGALDAVRDIVGWNSVYDAINRRPYMSLSRFWVAQKFGGFGIWLDDLFYHALMASLFDREAARDNLRAVLATETPEGNLPCLITGRDRWVDRSQPPIGAFILWKIVAHCGAGDLIDLAYPRLLANHEWWWKRRDPRRSGLMSWGTSPVGSGLYRGTKLAAKDESAMDNSPLHDETKLDVDGHCLDSWDVGLNALIALDGEILADWAAAKGDIATAATLRERAAALRARIADRLWDERRGIFANRLWSGDFIEALAPTSFYPLLAGSIGGDRLASLLHHLADPDKFGGDLPLPSVARDHPAYRDNVYWRGRIWPPLNYLVIQGLKRAGAEDAAENLAAASWRLFSRSWADRRSPENFSAETGAADDQPDTDLFYGWGGLMPLIAVNRRIDVSPWRGWEIRHDGRAFRLGPLLAFGGAETILDCDGMGLDLILDGERIWRSTMIGSHHGIRIDRKAGLYALTPPDRGGCLTFPDLLRSRMIAATYAGKRIAPRTAEKGSERGLIFDLPPREAGAIGDHGLDGPLFILEVKP